MTDEQQSEGQLRAKLEHLARNHRWTWHQPTADLLAAVPGASEQQHPMASIAALSGSQWADLESNSEFVASVEAAHAGLREALIAKPDPNVAYVSAEFGISELVPQYSGGLGILAGDHLKSASDLRTPLVGLGLFYREGFFRQGLENDQQTERYERCDPVLTGHVDTGVVVTVPVGSEDVKAKIWKLEVGTVDLYVLDTDLAENSSMGRAITDRLYSGGTEHRIQQELVLGLGGFAAIEALGLPIEVVHLNEGHAGFLLLAILEQELSRGATLDEAIATTKARSVFTTHTPVPAGIDRFDRSLITTYLAPWARQNNIPMANLVTLASGTDDGDEFNMAALCLSLTGAANGVSALHGKVSRELFGRHSAGAEIGSITNGVHARTWVAEDLARVFDEAIGSGWDLGSPEAWGRIAAVEDQAVRVSKTAGRAKLIELIADAGIDTSNLSSEALTVGFARRFATYKRADLLLLEAERLQAMLSDEVRPIQFVFAGKAHPADVPGKALLNRIVAFSESDDANGRFIFIPDYEMAIAKTMYAGCDVWLNNPIRPHEASGTSGEKAALNGGLQCSILDGWWDEMYDGHNGWAIANSDSTDPKERDRFESRSIADLLSGQILPLFYGDGRPSSAWIEKVRLNWATLGPKVTAARMVADYRDQVYGPALQRSRASVTGSSA